MQSSLPQQVPSPASAASPVSPLVVSLSHRDPTSVMTHSDEIAEAATTGSLKPKPSQSNAKCATSGPIAPVVRVRSRSDLTGTFGTSDSEGDNVNGTASSSCRTSDTNGNFFEIDTDEEFYPDADAVLRGLAIGALSPCHRSAARTESFAHSGTAPGATAQRLGLALTRPAPGRHATSLTATASSMERVRASVLTQPQCCVVRPAASARLWLGPFLLRDSVVAHSGRICTLASAAVNSVNASSGATEKRCYAVTVDGKHGLPKLWATQLKQTQAPTKATEAMKAVALNKPQRPRSGFVAFYAPDTADRENANLWGEDENDANAGNVKASKGLASKRNGGDQRTRITLAHPLLGHHANAPIHAVALMPFKHHTEENETLVVVTGSEDCTLKVVRSKNECV